MREGMEKFTESLRETFEQDWATEESQLKREHEKEVEILKNRFSKDLLKELAVEPVDIGMEAPTPN